MSAELSQHFPFGCADFTGMRRRELFRHFEKERLALLEAGMSESSIFKLHYGDDGGGGDYRVWIKERAWRKKRIYPKEERGEDGEYAGDVLDCIPDVRAASSDDINLKIALDVAVSSLSGRQKNCFRLCCEMELTEAGASVITGVSQQAVSKNVGQAKNNLKKYFYTWL